MPVREKSGQNILNRQLSKITLNVSHIFKVYIEFMKEFKRNLLPVYSLCLHQKTIKVVFANYFQHVAEQLMSNVEKKRYISKETFKGSGDIKK